MGYPFTSPAIHLHKFVEGGVESFEIEIRVMDEADKEMLAIFRTPVSREQYEHMTHGIKIELQEGGGEWCIM